MSVSGVAPADVLSAAIHRGEPGKTGPALYRLLVPGAVTGTGTIPLTPRDRAELADGKLYLPVYTRAQPLGALRGQLRLQAGRPD